MNFLLLALIKFEAAHLEVAVEDYVEESFLFIITITSQVHDLFTLEDYDVFRRDKFDFQVFAQPIQELTELFFACVGVWAHLVRIIEVLDGQLTQLLSEVVSHGQPKHYHVL